MAKQQLCEKEVEIKNTMGLHARPAALLVRHANNYKAEITLQRDENDEVDCRSLLGLLMLAAGSGTKLTLRAYGEDAELALEAIARVFEEKFGED